MVIYCLIDHIKKCFTAQSKVNYINIAFIITYRSKLLLIIEFITLEQISAQHRLETGN